jgi:chloramphenicol 3-O-phosphotransferase
VELVFLYGPAASGKLTVARELSRLTGLPVFHNHLVVDTLLEVFEFGSPEFVRLRELFWLGVFQEAAQSGRSLIFTFAPENTVRAGFHERAASVVTGLAGKVHFVELRVSAAEQERRLENPDRRQFHKLASVETLKRIRAEASGSPDWPSADLMIDTEAVGPREAAEQVRERFEIEVVDLRRGYRTR